MRCSNKFFGLEHNRRLIIPSERRKTTENPQSATEPRVRYCRQLCNYQSTRIQQNSMSPKHERATRPAATTAASPQWNPRYPRSFNRIERKP
jgi:hypothetical protein